MLQVCILGDAMHPAGSIVVELRILNAGRGYDA